MEFSEKLQELRKSRGLTQEELSEILFVSRAAVSKWESGRGYPNIESLKGISKFFSVSIDDLLSGDKLIDIAEKENKSNLRKIFDFLFGISDLFSFAFFLLPLYPNEIDSYVFSVPLFDYTQISPINLIIYWVMFISLFLTGILKVIFMKIDSEKCSRFLTGFSFLINILIVLLLALTREAYALIVAFVILIFKGIVYLKLNKAQ